LSSYLQMWHGHLLWDVTELFRIGGTLVRLSISGPEMGSTVYCTSEPTSSNSSQSCAALNKISFV
jgi:hypothetical protein